PFEEIRIMNATWSSQGDFRIDEGGTDCPDLPARCSDVIRLTNANSGTATIFVLSDISDAELNVDLLPSFGSGDTFPAKVLQESIGGTILVGDISTNRVLRSAYVSAAISARPIVIDSR